MLTTSSGRLHSSTNSNDDVSAEVVAIVVNVVNVGYCGYDVTPVAVSGRQLTRSPLNLFNVLNEKSFLGSSDVPHLS